MIFSLEVRRARKGDCLIVHYGTKADPGLILIDGGPAQVYKPHLKPRLDGIRAARKLAASESLPVDMLMVSHIDDDHINGILELTGELVDAKNAKKPLPLKIRSFWHNSFDDIIGNDPEELRNAVTAAFGPASLAGEPDEEGLNPDAAKVLASVSQGFRLRDNAKVLGLSVNPQFKKKLVKAVTGAKALDVGKGLSFLVAGPMEPELLELQKDHDDFLKKQKEKKTKAALASFTDSSVPNLSSIVVLAEADSKRMLLTGDARGDKILAGLELVGALKKGSKMHVDLLKMPHHGSDRNMETVFLQRVTADHYVFSGDGEHGNPERATIEMLRDARTDKREYTIHLTYPIDEIDAGRKADWEKEQAKEQARKKKNPGVKVRPDWKPKQNSLAAFFDANPAMAKRVKIVDANASHLIELRDKVGI